MTVHSDVAIVGTGLLGLATAFELVRRDLHVTLIGPRGRDAATQASRAAGAMLTVFSEVEARYDQERTALEVGERLAARRVYDDWLDTIGEASDIRTQLVPGVWVVANGSGEDDGAELQAIATAATSNGRPVEFGSPSDVPGLHPQMPAHGALWLEDEASVMPGYILDGLAIALGLSGRCQWVDAPAVELGETGEHLDIVTSDGTRCLSAHVVLACGAGVNMLITDAELAGRVALPTVLSGRGVALTVQAPFDLPVALRTPNRGFACGSHLVPRGNGLVYVGATNRLTTEPSTAPAPSLDELATVIHDGAAQLNVRLRDARLAGVHVGYRPVTFDHLPLFGTTGHPMVHLATGTYRCGVLLAPRAAQLVADGITKPGSNRDHPYSPCRSMPNPAIEEVAKAAGLALAEQLCQPGGTLPPGSGERLAGVLRAGLMSAARDHSTHAAVIRRLWQRAPMEECLPQLIEAMARFP